MHWNCVSASQCTALVPLLLLAAAKLEAILTQDISNKRKTKPLKSKLTPGGSMTKDAQSLAGCHSMRDLAWHRSCTFCSIFSAILAVSEEGPSFQGAFFCAMLGHGHCRCLLSSIQFAVQPPEKALQQACADLSGEPANAQGCTSLPWQTCSVLH